jgi:signal transduction histidine kinase
MMNLVVNARDAMPHGGKLTVGTRNIALKADDAAQHAGAKAGEYVAATVKDTGTGMDEKTRQRIFEPFFTTKEKDKGTGLGLSTVYGIVRQSGGWIDVSSEIGRGTSFTIYFPRIDGGAIAREANTPRAGRLQGCETILVVEDQDAVRSLTKRLPHPRSSEWK